MAKLTIDQVLQKGVDAHKAGQVQEAHRMYAAILKVQPKHPDANHNMGLLTVGFGKIELALPFFKIALEANPSNAQFWYSHIVALIKLDRLVDAKSVLDQAKSKGIQGADFDQLEQKLNEANKALSTKPDHAGAFYKMGNALQKQNKLEEAIEAYNKALAIKPDYANAYNDMGIAFQEQNKLEEAIEAYNQALAVKPDYAEALYNIGIALQEQNKLEEAIEAYNKALAIKPDYAKAHYNIGTAFQDQGKLEEAIEAYVNALAIKADYAKAYNNLGTAFQNQNKLEEAIEAYNQALAVKPDYAETYINIGIVLQKQNKLEEAIEAYVNALAIKADYSEAYSHMGTAFQEQNKLEEAIEAYSQALAIKPDYESVRAINLHQHAHICNWDSIAKDVNLIPELGTSEMHVSPFALLPLEDAPDRHLIRSKIYAKAKYPQKILPPRGRPYKRPKRIRIGYFSTDFKEHPVAYLISKVLEQHNRDQFEVFGYSVHGSSSCAMRQRLESSFDSFTDVQRMSDRDITLKVRQDEIDIAIDLNGYTENARTGIFAYRAAPIQINYLGYPGTLGVDFMDYIVADRFLIPSKNQKHFNEKPLYLPNTYMPTDDSRLLSQKHMNRSDMGLPDDAFVFCCFNNNYKISPNEFDIWMRLLTKVENSVLWLRQSNQSSNINMKNEAQKRKVDPSRLVFADKISMDEHLARQRFADLFVDTFAFNAHTTAAEALWAGLPVVTKAGLGFAARVAGSLLNAVGLPELVTETEQDYEELILELATTPIKLAGIKEKLAANRLTQPLFNTDLYTKHLENGYQQAYENYFKGNLPQTIIVPK
ncbi:tetratricopeptide repeat protein [Amylibacter sp.]|nr:tetratricopeptide repeat protein [Amylibacter sp.]